MTKKDVLPDCRTLTPKGAVHLSGWGSWIPIFCANCGKEGGKVPEENMTFIFWLCDNCFETCGKIAGTMAVPDEVVWEQIRQEQLTKQGNLTEV